MKKILIFISTILLSLFAINIISAQSIEINTCSVLNESGAEYTLSSNIVDYRTTNCIDIIAPNITLNCNGKIIDIPNINSSVVSSNQANTVIKNCIIKANRQNNGSAGIYLGGQNSVLYNNYVTNSMLCVNIAGDNNLISDNNVRYCGKAIHILYADSNIIKNNYVSNSGWGFGLWGDKNNKFINNKAEKNVFGIILNKGVDTNITCGIYTSNQIDLYLYAGGNSRTKAYGVVYTEKVNDNEMTKYPFDCKTMECYWQADKCVYYTNDECEDIDNDGYYGYKQTCYSGNDCNDNVTTINPNGTEICGNGIDENCDGKDDKCPVAVDKCMKINSFGYYYMNEDFTDTDFMNSCQERYCGYLSLCIDIAADNVIFDCKNHSIINNRFMKPIINIKGKNITVQNCILSSGKSTRVMDSFDIGHDFLPNVPAGIKINYPSEKIFIKNNTIIDSSFGVFATDGGPYEIDNNKFVGNQFGIMFGDTRGGALVRYNLIKNGKVGISESHGYSENTRAYGANKVYNNSIGIKLYSGGYNADIICGEHTNNSFADILLNQTYDVDLYSPVYNSLVRIQDSETSFENYNCKTLACKWFGDECLVDSDWDNVADANDECLNTPNNESVNEYGCSCSQIEIPFRNCSISRCYDENYIVYPESGYDECAAGIITKEHSCEALNSTYNSECDIDDDNDTIIDEEDLCASTLLNETQIVYGCSCSQVLEKMPGENKGLDKDKKECSKGIIEVFTKQIGWTNNSAQ